MGLKGFDVDATSYEINGDSKTLSGSDNAKLETIAGLTANGTQVLVYLDDDKAETIDNVVVMETQLMQINTVKSGTVTLKKVGRFPGRRQPPTWPSRPWPLWKRTTTCSPLCPA